MSASVDEVLSLLSKCKTEGRQLIIELRQSGQTNLWARAEISRLSPDSEKEKEVAFSFGYFKLASGEVVVPLSSDLLVITVLDPAKPRPLEPISPDFEFCIEFTWNLFPSERERLMICVLRKI